ncbi:aldo/keto reductase [Candidatus Fermentibacteria bacterium]|nr:aldo/keto reductase [Candidatus Fermentibacteria bacterium]
MYYRQFGRSCRKVSALGFGAMRLPTVDGDVSRIDEPEATRMIRAAIDGGVNYVDTAYPYHGGNSELFLSRALADGYRERVTLVTKMPTWLIESEADFDRYLNEQLGKLRTNHLEFYLLHSLNDQIWPKLKALNVLAWGERAVASGRIGGMGFSFHDGAPVFIDIVNDYDKWALAQVQYNYMDAFSQAGTAGVRYAAERGIPLVVMEPLRGGQLARKPPQVVQEVWSTAPVQRTLADWALQWLWDQPEVSVVLSGMSTMEQVDENLASANRSRVGALTDDEHGLIERVREAFMARRGVPCTGCGYCLPCPNGVHIPEVFMFYNDALVYDDLPRASMSYRWVEEENRASRCTRCGHCEPLCPQHIAIPDLLAEAEKLLTAKA